jgi:hypothetical protein
MKTGNFASHIHIAILSVLKTVKVTKRINRCPSFLTYFHTFMQRVNASKVVITAQNWIISELSLTNLLYAHKTKLN